MGGTDLITSYVELLFDTVTSARGIAGIAVAIVLAIAAVRFFSVRMAVLAGILLLSALTPRLPPPQGFTPSLSSPLYQISLQSRPAVLGGLVVLLLPIVLAPGARRTRLFPAAAIGLFCFQMAFCARLFLGELYTRGILNAVGYVLMFVVLVIGVGKWMPTRRDAYRGCYIIAMAAAIFVLASAYQGALNPGAMAPGGRFAGVTPNAQAAGILLSMSLPAVYAIVLRPGDFGKWWKPGLAVLLGMMLFFLLWTSSRTAVLATTISGMVFFRRRVKALVVCGLLGAVFLLGAVALQPEALDATDRLMGGRNTRAAVWSYLLEDFYESPLIGLVDEQFTKAESSYLTVAARMGAVGLLVLFGLHAIVFKDAVSLWRIAKHGTREERALADATIAAFVAFGVIMVFEATIVAVLGYWVIAIYIYMTIAARLFEPDDQGDLPALLENGGEPQSNEKADARWIYGY